MTTFSSSKVKSFEDLFSSLYFAKDEDELHEVILENPSVFASQNWAPLGGDDTNYATIKNQQSSPIAALIEKVTNSIDALLMKKAYEQNLDPKSSEAPQTMDDALVRFFPDHKNWDIGSNRREQAKEIQIIADGKGPRKNRKLPTSVIIYDNGEGQNPDKFEDTFLSIKKGNKNEIQFVQGKYNMGGTGAIVFCGKKNYQLIASRRYDGKGEFGFTLIREHKKVEADKRKETWYEFLKIDERIPSFQMEQSIELGLEDRKFNTGSLIKMYSYQFPKTGYSGFAQDLNQSLNEYLYKPILPVMTKDTALRYPKNNVLTNTAYGLNSRFDDERAEYVDENFSLKMEDSWIGPMLVNCYVFKNRVMNYDLKKSKEVIRDRYFKNGMSILFSMNGQVHGSYTTEFISRSLKMNILSNHLLVHVDCTDMHYDFRKNLFMASRDRLKNGDETQHLRHFLASKLAHKDGRLQEIVKNRKDSISFDSASTTKELVQNLSQNMPFDNKILSLLKEAYNIEDFGSKKNDKQKNKKKKQKEEVQFKAERFPTFLKLQNQKDGEIQTFQIPLGGEKTIRFKTDAENDYFDRTEEPGEFQIALLGGDGVGGGNNDPLPNTPKKIINVNRTSPNNGTIKINLDTTEEAQVGDMIQVSASLSSLTENFTELFLVKIADTEKPKKTKVEKESESNMSGLPDLVLAYKEKKDSEGTVCWEDVENATNQGMDYETSMIPMVSGNVLEKVFINMDCGVLKDFKSKDKNASQSKIELADRKYYTSIYFHVLFLYTITINRKFKISVEQENETEEEVNLEDYLKDIFSNYYSSFILNFNSEVLMEGLGE
jgi:hypothetical protein